MTRTAITYFDTKAAAQSINRKLRRANVLSKVTVIKRGHVSLTIYVPHTMTDDDMRKMVARSTTAYYEPLCFRDEG